MKRVFIIAITAPLAASAWAGTFPNAADEHVMRFGPLASGVYDVDTIHHSYQGPTESERRGGGGVVLWGQYDRTWIGYAMRLGATVADFGGTSTFIDWENEFSIYLLKRRFRPFIMPVVGVGYTISERRGGGKVPIGLYLGARWNAAGSPFYMTVSAGGRQVIGSEHEWRWVTIRSQGYFGLTDTVALYAGIEVGRGNHTEDFGYIGYDDVTDWRFRLDVGPSWAF